MGWYCIVTILLSSMDTKRLWLEIIFSNVIKSKEFEYPSIVFLTIDGLSELHGYPVGLVSALRSGGTGFCPWLVRRHWVLSWAGQ